MNRKCPTCGGDAASWLRKLLLGPGFSTACRQCGERVSLSWASYVAAVPLLASTAITYSMAPWSTRDFVWAVACGLTAILVVLAFPIVKVSKGDGI